MKRLLPLFCVLVLVFASTGVASAHSSQPEQFSITGYTTSYEYRILSNGRTTTFNLTAAGQASGYLEGPFTFKEWGTADFNPETGQGTGKGVNTGLLTITKEGDPNSEALIWFGGKSTLTTVSGAWKVLSGKGAWRNLEGKGTYTGDAGLVFTVVFTGNFD